MKSYSKQDFRVSVDTLLDQGGYDEAAWLIAEGLDRDWDGDETKEFDDDELIELMEHKSLREARELAADDDEPKPSVVVANKIDVVNM